MAKSKRLCATLVLAAITAFRLPLVALDSPSLPSAPGLAAPRPIIQVDDAVYDFGKAAVGEKVRHTYFVTNMGNETLHITNVHPSCGCTSAGSWTHDIEPGKTGEIPVQFDTSRFGGFPPISKTIEVDSNAGNEPRKILWLKGTVWRPIEVAPVVAMIGLGSDATNEVSTAVRIVNKTDHPFSVSNVVSANHFFRAVLKETKPGKEYELVITAALPFSAGNSPGVISVNTSLPSTPVINVTAVTYVKTNATIEVNH
jgi:hypothetical protein